MHNKAEIYYSVGDRDFMTVACRLPLQHYPLHNKLHPLLQVQFTSTRLLPDQLTNIVTDIILSIILHKSQIT